MILAFSKPFTLGSQEGQNELGSAAVHVVTADPPRP